MGMKQAHLRILGTTVLASFSWASVGTGLAFTEIPAPAPVITDAEFYGSAMMMPENGRTTTSGKNGRFIVTNWRTQAGGGSSVSPFWQGQYSAVALIDRHSSKVDGQFFAPHVFGTEDSQQPRSMGLRYFTHRDSNTGMRGKFRFWVFGEPGVGAWSMDSAVIPKSAKGPLAVFAFHNDTNGFLHVLDTATGTWYDGSAVAKPASWAGLSATAATYDLAIGGTGDRALNHNFGPSFQACSAWRGSIGDVLICNHALSKSAVEGIVNGANPVTTATGAGATHYTHIPMVVNGDISSTVTSTYTGLSLTQQGTVKPGGTLRRQSTANYITLDPYNPGEPFPVARGGTTARVRLKGKVGGLTGTLRYRIVVDPSGLVWRNWTDSGITVTAGAFDGHVTIPEFLLKGQVQVAMSGDMSVVASSHFDCMSGPVLEFHAQSEGQFATLVGTDGTGFNTTLNPSLPANADTVTFAHIIDAASNQFTLVAAQDQPGLIGDGCAAIVNRIRQLTQRSVHIRVNAVSGTSQLALMNDADTTREWSDLEALRDFTQSKGPSGEAVVTGHVIYGWEAQIGPTNVMPVAYKPLLTGVGAASGAYDRTSNIPTADIDHYLFDGSSSANALAVVSPSNRETPGGSGAASDASNRADRRDHMRNYSHIYNYLVGPETTAHMLEGETAAGGLPAGGSAHAEQGNWEGVPELGLTAADALLLAAGIGTFPGPVFFETLTTGTAANKVKVRLGLPRLNPGQGLAEGATGYSLSAQSGSYTYALHTKKNGGDPGAGFEARRQPSGGSFGAWSKANVTSGTITNAATGEVELTLAWSLGAGDVVEIRYLPGCTGNYSSGTITQANWRAGVLYFNGAEYAAGEPNSVDDLLDLGWQVAGSNMALALTV